MDRDQLDHFAEQTDVPLVRRSRAAEKSQDMDALRQLANAQARVAISQSKRTENRDKQFKAAINYLYALGSACCGVACLLFVAGFVKLIAVSITVVITLIYIREGRRMFAEAEFGDTSVASEPEPDHDADDDEYSVQDYAAYAAYDEYDSYEEVYEYDEDDRDLF